MIKLLQYMLDVRNATEGVFSANWYSHCSNLPAVHNFSRLDESNHTVPTYQAGRIVGHQCQLSSHVLSLLPTSTLRFQGPFPPKQIDAAQVVLSCHWKLLTSMIQRSLRLYHLRKSSPHSSSCFAAASCSDTGGLSLKGQESNEYPNFF